MRMESLYATVRPSAAALRRRIFRAGGAERFGRLLFALVLVCALAATAGCGGKSDGKDAIDKDEATPGAEAPDWKTAETAGSTLALTPMEYPRVDGSTLTVPFSEAAAAAVLGLPPDQARLYVAHNETHDAYLNLIDGVVDIIFVTPPFEDEMAYAKEKGVELNIMPILRDGLVFFVNRKNTLSELSSDEIVDIYSNKIKNWKDAGGADAEIKAYRLPEDSLSRTGMKELVMKETPLAKAPKERIFSEMGGIVDAVAYDTDAAGALGYSYYYYTKNVWGDGQIKYVKIDGVAPDGKSIADGSYPFISTTYMVLRQGEPADSAASRLAAWVLSDEGKAVAEKTGYIYVR
jgi:phosphate transport system substrate-binding protein